MWRPEWAAGARAARARRPRRPWARRSSCAGSRSPTGESRSASLRASSRSPRSCGSTDGSFRRIELGDAARSSRRVLRARCRALRFSSALEIVPPRRDHRAWRRRGERVRRVDPHLGAARDGSCASGSGEGGVVTSSTPDGVAARLSLTLQRDVFPPRAARRPTTSPPSVLVTPRLAELAGGVGGTCRCRWPARRFPCRWPASSIASPERAGDDGRRRSRSSSARRSTRWRRAALARTSSGSTSRPSGWTPSRLRSRGRRSGRSTRRCEQRSRRRRGGIRSLAARCSRSSAVRSSRSCSLRSVSRWRFGRTSATTAASTTTSRRKARPRRFLRRVVRARAASLSLVGLVAGSQPASASSAS